MSMCGVWPEIKQNHWDDTIDSLKNKLILTTMKRSEILAAFDWYRGIPA
jgi:hypothetical protein